MKSFSAPSKLSSWWNSLFGRKKPLPNLGRRVYVDPSAHFIGANFVKIGARSIISEGCWFNVTDRSGSEPRIIIGDHCIISRRALLNSGKKITIGPYCLIGNESNFLGADHDFSNPFVPYLVPSAIAGDEISVGANCWLGSNCTVLKGANIGFGCVVGAGSVLTKPIPPLSIAVGNPCRVVRRFSVTKNQWISAADWGAEDQAALPKEETYLAKLRENHRWVSMPYVIGGRRYGNI